MSIEPQLIQKDYYARTASRYDEMHTSDEKDEHYLALQLINCLSETYELGTFLDVGAGTGRGVLSMLNSGKKVQGIEPVHELIEQGIARGVPEGLVIPGSGDSLPFADNSFDAVFECGVLHHVSDPSLVVGEMIRVARKAVFISDNNRFGQGRFLARFAKLALFKAGLWPTVRFVQTRGKMYSISEGDGLYYSYSVFDSLSQLSRWADVTLLIPTKTEGPVVKSWFHPLMTNSHILLCAIKNVP
jgi:ubiquinone/menaquinone biosynthesis C-methylase UbiE